MNSTNNDSETLPIVPDVSEADERSTLKQVAFASFFGSFIEWFDYGSYLYFASVISVVFFPDGNKTLAILQTYAVFALSFLMRPIGAVVWGYLGDRKGRRWTLTMTILVMTAATVGIGLLPPYAAAGYLSSVCLLLLRMAQGFSASGEYSGAATFLAEYAPRKQRGLYCSLVPSSAASGLLLGSATATAFNMMLSEQSLHSWGWRIPFLVALPLGIIVWYVRVRLEDSPSYRRMQDNLKKGGKEPQASPTRLLFRHHFKPLMISFGVASLNAVGFYMVLTYLPNYMTETVKMDPGLAHGLTTVMLVVYIAFIFGMGILSDRFGRKKMLITACIGFIVSAIPAFLLLDTGSWQLTLAVMLVMAAILTVNDGTLASFLSESFPTEVRFSGFALSFNMANAIFGGTVPMISTWLIDVTGSPLAPGYYLMAVSAAALVAMFMSEEHHNREL